MAVKEVFTKNSTNEVQHTDETSNSNTKDSSIDHVISKKIEHMESTKDDQSNSESEVYEKPSNLSNVITTKEKKELMMDQTKEKLHKSLKEREKKKEQVKKNIKEEMVLQAQERKEKPDIKIRKGFWGKLNSIRVKLIAAFLIPIAFIIVLGITSYNNASNALVSSYEESTSNSVVTARNYFELAANAVELRLSQLKGYDSLKDYYGGTYQDDQVQETLTYKEVKAYVESTAFADNLVSNIGIFCKRGEALCTTGRYDLSGVELFNAYKETPEGIIDTEERGGYTWAGRHSFFDDSLKIDAAKPKQPYAFSVSSAFLGNGLKPIGYVIADLSYDLVAQQLVSLEVGDDSIFAVISEDGYEVLNRQSEEILVANQDFYQQVVASSETEGSSYVTYHGEKYLFAFAKVGKTGLVVCGLVPNSYLTSQATSILTSTVILVIIAVLVATAVATFISTGMGRTILRMIKAMKSAAEGDLTVSVVCHRNDEFRVLSDSANHMIGNMKALIDRASKVKDTIHDSTTEVAESTDSLTIATKNISNSIEEIRMGIVQQAQDSEKCLRESEELGSRVTAMSDSIISIEQMTRDSKNIVNEGVVSVNDLKVKADQTAAITATVITDMNSLKEESKSIDKIINVINDIAEQTNLLSLNASIEAARAGEAGRGFAVVADEIRKLAEQSMKASGEISSIIRSIQDMTNHTVDTVKESDDIVKTQSIALDATVQLFEKINDSVEDIAHKLDDITAGISEIKEAENTTIGAIESISAVSEETAAASEEVDNAANRQVTTVETLKQATISLTAEAEELNKALSIFKI